MAYYATYSEAARAVQGPATSMRPDHSAWVFASLAHVSSCGTSSVFTGGARLPVGARMSSASVHVLSRRTALSFEGCLRKTQRHGPAAGLVGQLRSPPAEPDGQPSAQCRAASHRTHPSSTQPTGSRVSRTSASGWQQYQGGHALPQATPLGRRVSSARCRP